MGKSKVAEKGGLVYLIHTLLVSNKRQSEVVKRKDVKTFMG
jgi:hypothetical protein